MAGGRRGGADNPVRVNTSEVFDPASRIWRPAGDIAIGNEVSPIVLLLTGEVLMTHRPPQLYNPEAGRWRLAADFVQGDRMPDGDHSDHEIVLMPDGRVVAIGYRSFSHNPGYLVEIYNPLNDAWEIGADLVFEQGCWTDVSRYISYRAGPFCAHHFNHWEEDMASEKESVVYLPDPACLERRLKLEAIFNSVSDGILSVDGNLRITSFNRAAERVLSVSAEDAVGQRLADVFWAQEYNLSRAVRGVVAQGERLEEQEVTLTLKDGTRRWVVLNADPLTDVEGEPAGAVVVFRDVSEVRQLREELKGRYRFHALVGKNRRMREVYDLIEQTAATNATVLIGGESGTGKELVAHAIHYSSPRADGPFVRVNCSALPETLLESELFGHVKGAFTDAVADRVGRFEAADGGTIFLDEVGDLSPLVQLKLLRVLQEREFERVGSRETVRIDVRVIAATNRDLRRLVKEGKFREDLYYRLRVVPITLPPLRERKDDIPLLVAHTVEKFNREMDRDLLGPTEEAMAAMLDYAWPGNVRELENAIEHAFVRCRSKRFGLEDLPGELRLEAEAEERPAIPDDPEQEKALVLQMLEEAGGNRTKAARMLGISRTTLWKRLKDYGK